MKLAITAALAATLALPATAANNEHTRGQYKFVGTDNTLETKLCLTAVSDQVRQFKRQIADTGLRRSRIAKGLKCNDVNVTVFAYQYGANTTGDFLNRYNKVLGKTSIQDIALKTSGKPMIIYVSSK